MSKFLHFFLALLISTFSLAQNSSISSGNWSNASNWSLNKTPSNRGVAISNHSMILDKNIKIVNNGNYTIAKPLKESVGGAKYNITLSNHGVINLKANIFIEGNLILSNNAKLFLRSGDTLVVEGNANISNNVEIEIEQNAVLIIKGNLKMTNQSDNKLDGKLLVHGNAKFTNNSKIHGNGSFQTKGNTKLTNSASIFGSSSNCNNPPCIYGSGAGLPIVLQSFDAKIKEDKSMAIIEWTTASEINNNYFILEHSVNGSKFKTVATIDGAGNSNIERRYKKEVSLENNGTHYFRLTQVDFDGKSETFSPVYLNNNTHKSISKNEITVFPNPSNGDRIGLKSNSLESGTYKMVLLRSDGRTILTKNITVTENSLLQIDNILNGKQLNKGLYMLQLHKEEVKHAVKLIVR